MNRSTATKLAKKLMRQHGLICSAGGCDTGDWAVCCDKSVDHSMLKVLERGDVGHDKDGKPLGFAGACIRSQKVILLSPYVFETQLTDAEAKRVILHEIAHALASKDGHHAEWRRIAKRIGGLEVRRG